MTAGKFGNIPRIIIARRKIFPYLCRAPLGHYNTDLRSAIYRRNRQFQDNRQWYKHLLYGGLFVRVYLGVWRCLSIADRQPTSSLLTPLSGCKGEKTLKNHACTTVWHNAVFILQYKPIRHIHYGTPLQLQDVTRQPFRS